MRGELLVRRCGDRDECVVTGRILRRATLAFDTQLREESSSAEQYRVSQGSSATSVVRVTCGKQRQGRSRAVSNR
jgi:hypothetical protein